MTTVIVSEGKGKIEISDIPREWAELLCSRSAQGCGTVFWVPKSECKESWDYDGDVRGGGGLGTCLGWLTKCPKCATKAGGVDVKFVMLTRIPQ